MSRAITGYVERTDEIMPAVRRNALLDHDGVIVHNRTKNASYRLTHRLSSRQIDVLTAGGQIS